MCFYLKWTDDGCKDRKKYVAQWTNIDSIDSKLIKWKCRVNFKDIGEITLATDYVTKDPFVLLKENPYNNTSYLKSHLQKSIRRGNVNKSLKTALHFYDNNANDFLRRLCIIAIEDALPLEGFSTIVWFMSAYSKNYNISESHMGWILGYVHDLAKCQYYEQMDKKLAQKKNKNIRNLRLYQLPQDGKDLCYSIMFRQGYGGMRSDKAMCLNATMLWSMRYSTNSRFLQLLDRKHIFMTPPTTDLLKNEWFSAAIDFHCYTGIIDYLWERNDEFDQEQIKNAIWHCSSCITNKKNIATDIGQRDWSNEKHIAVWNVIKKDFMGISKFMILKNS